MQLAELIKTTDSLNDGRVKLNVAITDSETALNTANTAKTTADLAKSESTNTQTQLDNIVIEGDSSVEAAQARVNKSGTAFTTLKQRLDEENEEVTAQLQKTVTKGSLFYDVKDFGAKGNAHFFNQNDQTYYQDALFTIPATDDTDAFNRALLSDQPHTGGNGTDLKRTVLIPDGDYLIEGTVYVRKGQHLKGSGIGASRILIPATNRTEPTFLMGLSKLDGIEVLDSGGLPPTISDLSTEGGSLQAPVFDGTRVGGISLYNLFITAAGIGFSGAGGDLFAHNITIDDCQIGMIASGSRNTYSGISFFWNVIALDVRDSAYDVIFTGCNFAYSKIMDVQFGNERYKNVSFKDCNFIGNGQYESNVAGILLNETVEAVLNIHDCHFSNLYNFAVSYYGVAKDNQVLIDGCIFDGNKTHDSYIQGISSKGVTVGNNHFKIVDCHFKNLKGTRGIVSDGVSGSLLVSGCTWENNINLSSLIHLDKIGTIVTAVNNVGDNITPLINCIVNETSPAYAEYVYIGKNDKWLGAIQVGSSKKYIKIPTFGAFNGLVSVVANTLPRGHLSYRKTGLFNLHLYTDYAGNGINDVVNKTALSVAELFTAPVVDIEVSLDNVGEANVSPSRHGRYVVVAVPDSWNPVEIRVTPI